MFKTLSAFTILALFGSPVLANTIEDHQELWTAIKSVGVSIRVNQSTDCDPKLNSLRAQIFGWYSGLSRVIAVCQSEAIRAGQYDQGQVVWTDEDLDTLRHEAHHLVQDCMDDQLDGQLESIYKQPIELALKVLGREKSNYVLELYDKATDHIKVMELEAFSVAQMNEPIEQVNDIKRYCF